MSEGTSALNVTEAPKPARNRRKTRPAPKAKETDHQVMTGALKAFGHIRLSVYVKIRHPNVAKYVGFRDSGITIDAPTLELAEEFPDRLKTAVAKLAQDMGMKLRRVVMVDKAD